MAGSVRGLRLRDVDSDSAGSSPRSPLPDELTEDGLFHAASLRRTRPPMVPTAPDAFLQSVLTDAEALYVMRRLKPTSTADLQLAVSEKELQGWLPELGPLQVRKLWHALQGAAGAVPGRHIFSPPQRLSVVSASSLLMPGTANSEDVVVDISPPLFSPSGSYRRESARSAPRRPTIQPPRLPAEKSRLLNSGVLWLDLCADRLKCHMEGNPKKLQEYIEELARQYHIHPVIMADALSPEELPKTELHEGVLTCIMRYCRAEVFLESRPGQDDLTELTAKLMVVLTHHPDDPDVHVVVVIHDESLRPGGHGKAFEGYLQLQKECEPSGDPLASVTNDQLINLLFEDVLQTYAVALEHIERDVDPYEQNLTNWVGADATAELYAIRRRVSVLKRLLRLTQESLLRYAKLAAREAGHDPIRNDLSDTVKSLLFTVEDQAETTTELLNLHIALNEQRSSKLLYTLTILTVFFTPITFVTSFYGMNFVNMPELNWDFGELYSLALIGGAITLVLLFLWWHGFICQRSVNRRRRKE